jgi:hypothetical protein
MNGAVDEEGAVVGVDVGAGLVVAGGDVVAGDVVTGDVVAGGFAGSE